MHARVTTRFERSRLDTGRESTRPIRALNRGLEVLTEFNRLERAAINTLASAVRLTANHHLSNPGDSAPGRLCRPRPARRLLPADHHGALVVGWLRRRGHGRAHRQTASRGARGADHLAGRGCDAGRGNHDDSRDHGSRQSARLGAVRRRRARTHARPRPPAAHTWHFAQARSATRCSSCCRARPCRKIASREAASRWSGLLDETRAQGYGMAHRARRVSEETSLAIPVRGKERVLATVTVRYAATAVPLRTAVEQFLPKMREVAQKIETEFV